MAIQSNNNGNNNGAQSKNSAPQMKWWGWGDEDKRFNIDDKPTLWPFLCKKLGVEGELVETPPVSINDIEMPRQNLNEAFFTAIKDKLRPEQIHTDKKDRLVHAYGKSFRDLWRIRRGIVDFAPDCIIYPESEEEVVTLLTAATEHQVIIIPFGGGSNIAGCLEVRDVNGRMVVSLDMKRMNQVLELDEESCTARIQAGVLGPDMEAQLQERGHTLGHFPDSFEFSTLGGWVATRSAGMQSDKYGKIEDMVVSLRMVTPSGTIVTRSVPKASNGININQLCIGSEGILGVITEATMQVHPLPEYWGVFGYLFPDFELGIKAIHECIKKECRPVFVRLNDAGKTQLSFAFKSHSTPFKEWVASGMKAYLKKFKGFDMDKVCLMLTAFEGDYDLYQEQRRKVDAVYKKYQGFYLGRGPGRAFERGKYDFPYIRDLVMDYNIMADVSETSTVWSNLHNLYKKTMDHLDKAISDTGVVPFLGCHISHSYFTGTSLYFSFGCQQVPGKELQQYLYIKKAAEDSFINNGGTLSHHHAVGFEHLPWVEQDISPTGVKAVESLKKGLDPMGIMNPGKILPNGITLEEWGLSDADIRELENRQSKTPTQAS